MRRIVRSLRVVVVPMAVVSILFGSAVPASAASETPVTIVAKVTKPVFKTLGMVW